MTAPIKLVIFELVPEATYLVPCAEDSEIWELAYPLRGKYANSDDLTPEEIDAIDHLYNLVVATNESNVYELNATFDGVIRLGICE